MRRKDIVCWAINRFLSVNKVRLLLLPLVSAICWSCAPVNHELQPDLVIGVVDPQRILLETTKGTRLSETLNAFMKDRQVLVELEQKELRDLEEEIRAQRTVLSQSARELKEEQFRQKMAAYQQKVADLNREVQEKQRELQNEFRRQVSAVVTQIAKARNLGLVIEHGVSSGTLFYQESWDISSEVIQALNQKSEHTGAP
ncbi:MAG: OmpH family outer membrane protein [Nitrospirales bacterium]